MGHAKTLLNPSRILKQKIADTQVSIRPVELFIAAMNLFVIINENYRRLEGNLSDLPAVEKLATTKAIRITVLRINCFNARAHVGALQRIKK